VASEQAVSRRVWGLLGEPLSDYLHTIPHDWVPPERVPRSISSVSPSIAALRFLVERRAWYFSPVTLSVDINHWLDEHGELPTNNLRLRRNTLRILRLIESGATLDPLRGRETLVECKRRPNQNPCLGLMWVVKRNDHRIEAFCPVCQDIEALISGWEETLWAEGPMEPVPMTDD
jgi:hypothetical protein